MIGLKGIGYVTLSSVLLAAIIFAWYAFVAPLIGLDFTNEINQLAAAFIGVIICFAAYALTKPDF